MSGQPQAPRGVSHTGRRHDHDRLDRGARQLAEVYLLVGPLYRRVMGAVSDDIEDGRDGVSVPERAVLDVLLRRGPLTVPAIAADQDLSRQFVQRTINGLVEAGLLTTAANPSHKRSVLIALTTAGEDTISAVLAREHAQLREAFDGLTAEHVDHTIEVLTHLLGAIPRRPRA